MKKLVLSWKYWACLVLTGAAVILVLGEPGEWLNAAQWWTQFVVQKAAGVRVAAGKRLVQGVGRGISPERREASERRETSEKTGKPRKDGKARKDGKPRKARNGLRPRPEDPDIPGAMRRGTQTTSVKGAGVLQNAPTLREESAKDWQSERVQTLGLFIAICRL